MISSKLEINLKRLLKCAETMSRDDFASSDWKLEKYVAALSEMLQELEKKSNKPDEETLKEYMKRIEFLKKLVDSQKIDNPEKRVVALQMMSRGIATSDDNISREIVQKTTSKNTLDIRNELFSLSQDNKNEIRHRIQQEKTSEDVDSIIKHHQIVQEKIVDNMLLLTRDLKEQTKLANSIIKKDIETIQKSTGLADKNLSRLKVESNKLDSHNKKAWRIWMWVNIFVVVIIFICKFLQ